MLSTTIRMKVFPEKRKELLQAITSLLGSIKLQKGCRRCDFCISAEDENEFCLFGEWESQEDLEKHLDSDVYKVLLGAMSLLKNPHDMKLYRGMPADQSVNLLGELNGVTI
jgi:quinol monooxygenase YgiN